MGECTLFIISINVVGYLLNALLFYHYPEIIIILKAGTVSYDGFGYNFYFGLASVSLEH